MRYTDGDGDTGRPDPAFPLNDPALAGAQIMLTGSNFGCGSSRETAPMAIGALGFRVLIGSTFGDIFFNNCFQQGLLPIALAPPDVEALASDGGELTVDLEAQTITDARGRTTGFEINALRKACLLEGTDLIGLTLGLGDDIDRWQARDRSSRPWIWELSR
jgi:3-isopropylmalate/(R)-2-methylmalate dehydratase small subunit